MKFRFDPDLDFQRRAIQSIVKLFDGQPHGQIGLEAIGQEGMLLQSQGVGNNLVLSDDQLLANTHIIQEENNILKVETFQGRDFSIEMETGTGKTYVYLRTIFELNKNYGFKKFIIVVPSIAVKEGVIKSIDTMRDHFSDRYDKVPFESYLYDSKGLNKIRNFRDSNDIQIMVINIQAFQRDISEEEFNIDDLTEEREKNLNIIYRENDRMGGRPIDFINSTMPIVIIDEPQSVDTTEKSKKAISQLNPAVVLRYSATHKNPYNLLYKLGPVEAYDQRLVKRIEIASIYAEENHSSAYIKYIKGTNTGGTIKATLEIHKRTNNGIKIAQVSAKQGDDLYIKSGEHQAYQQGFIIDHIDITGFYGSITLSRGQEIPIGRSIGGHSQDIMKMMVRETVEQHLKKELLMRGHGVKVLSLFFIDRVENYRIYGQDGTTTIGKIGKWFEEYYHELIQKEKYKNLIPFKVDEIHNGYFSKDRKGKIKDTRGGTKDDEDTYSLIMKEKEKLLDINEPLRFIFSHTALKEGWDNPNVFQICTLREVGSEIERRQQIGRGLRLAVNQVGERIHDTGLNRLTVISSEGYEEYANALQNEYEQDLGIKFGIIEKHHFAKIIRINSRGEEQTISQDSSGKIWNNLKNNGYINDKGEILNAFAPDNESFVFKVAPEFSDISENIIDEVKKHILKTRVANAHKRQEIELKKQVYLGEDFKDLWNKVAQRTSYKVSFDTSELISIAIEKIKKMKEITPIKVISRKAVLELKDSGIQATATTNQNQYSEIKPKNLPNIITYLQRKTELTRNTLMKILTDCERMDDFFKNPYRFMDNVADVIMQSMKSLMLRDIRYKKIDNNFWRCNELKKMLKI